MIITTATADNRKEKPSNNSAAGCSRVGTLPRKLGRKPGEALNAECMSIATITALPEALNAISTERPIRINVKTRGEVLLHLTRNSGRCHAAHMIPMSLFLYQ